MSRGEKNARSRIIPTLMYYNYRGDKSVRSCVCPEKRNIEVEGARCNQEQNVDWT